MCTPKGNTQAEETKMNEKTTKQIKEMMNQTIGVEVEMNSITRAKAAQIAAEFFGTRRHEIGRAHV